MIARGRKLIKKARYVVAQGHLDIRFLLREMEETVIRCPRHFSYK